MENHLSMQKFKLIKEYEDYYLISDKEIESGDEYVKLDNRPRTVLLGTTAPSTKVPKLSKQNCEEEFAKAMGVVDVEKLAYDYSWTVQSVPEYGTTMAAYKQGFNKATELNKDKVFTIEDLNNFRKFQIQEQNFSKSCLDVWLKLLQKPTEIEVEIVGSGYIYKNVIDICPNFHPKFGCSLRDDCTCANNEIPKLDSSGCLVLRKL